MECTICFKIAWDKLTCSMCAVQRFCLLGSPNNGLLLFLVLTLVVIYLLLVFFSSFLYMFYFVLWSEIPLWKTADYCFYSNRSRLRTKVCKLGPEDQRAVGLPWSLVLQSEKHYTVGRTFLKSQPRGTGLISPPQVHAQILALCLLSKCSYLIF